MNSVFLIYLISFYKNVRSNKAGFLDLPARERPSILGSKWAELPYCQELIKRRLHYNELSGRSLKELQKYEKSRKRCNLLLICDSMAQLHS